MNRKKMFLLVFFCIVLIIGVINSSSAVDTVLITDMYFCNSMQKNANLTSRQWVENEKLRAWISMLMILDFSFDNHSRATLNDIDYLESSCIFEDNGTIYLVVRGTQYLKDYNVLIMYSPDDKDGAYSLFPTSDANYALLHEALKQTYGTPYENSYSEILSVAESLGESFSKNKENSGVNAEGLESNNLPATGERFSCGLLRIRVNGKWGFINKNGEMAIPAQWDHVYDFDEGLTEVFIGSLNKRGKPDVGKHGIINAVGEYVIPLTECASISAYEAVKNGISITYKKGESDYDYEYEYLKMDGTKIFDLRFDNCYDPDGEKLLCAKINDKWGYMNRETGEIAIDFIYDDATSFADGKALVAQFDQNRKLSYFYIDESGTIVIPNKGWDYAQSIEKNEHATCVFVGTTLYDGETPDVGKYAVIDDKGKLLCDYEWDDVGYYSEGLLRVAQKDRDSLKWGFINSKAEIIVEPSWDYVSSFYNGFAYVFKGSLTEYGLPESGKYAFIDANGNLITDLVWDDVEIFCSDGYAVVGKEDKSGNILYGIIDKSGKLIVPLKWNEIKRNIYQDRLFANELCCVSSGGKYGYIDSRGELKLTLEWDDANVFSEGVAVVWKDDSWYLINSVGRILSSMETITE